MILYKTYQINAVFKMQYSETNLIIFYNNI